jgi:hypothetical protein
MTGHNARESAWMLKNPVLCPIFLMNHPFPLQQCKSSEIEFLDIDLTKDSSLLLHAIHIPFYWWILMKIILLPGFKNPYKKILDTRKLEYIHE